MGQQDEGFDREQVLEDAETLGWEETAQRMLEEEGEPGSISSEMNMYYGVLNRSMGQVSSNEPLLLVYDHSPGFQRGEHGMAKLSGKSPDAVNSSKVPGRGNVFTNGDEVETKYVRFEVHPEEAMPTPARYDGSEVPELVLEHETVDMLEDDQVTFQVHPYDPEDITGESWEENLRNYDGQDVSFIDTSNT